MSAKAAATYHYKADEYVQISSGLSPDGHYSIRAHGEGDSEDDNFHLYLFEVTTSKRIDPFAEEKKNIDTAADAFTAAWSPDAKFVAISYRTDTHVVKTLRYRIEDGQATLILPKPR